MIMQTDLIYVFSLTMKKLVTTNDLFTVDAMECAVTEGC